MLTKFEKNELLFTPLAMLIAFIAANILGWQIIGNESLEIITIPLSFGICIGLGSTLLLDRRIYPLLSMNRFTILVRIGSIIVIAFFLLFFLLFNSNNDYIQFMILSNILFGTMIAIFGIGSYLTYYNDSRQQICLERDDKSIIKVISNKYLKKE